MQILKRKYSATDQCLCEIMCPTEMGHSKQEIREAARVSTDMANAKCHLKGAIHNFATSGENEIHGKEARLDKPKNPNRG